MLEYSSERDRRILAILTATPTASVHQLAQELGVSDVTIRQDLKNLATRGLITRTHGGATPAFHRNILDSQSERAEQKNRIARLAAALVQDGDTIMIEAGTTTALLPKYLLGKTDIHIVTDSTLLFPSLRSNPALRLTVVGGEFRTATESFTGPLALEAIRRFNVKYAFLGADGLSLERGLSTYQVEGAEVFKAMVAQAFRSVVLADSSKLGKSGFVTIMPLNAVDTLISDSEFDPATAAKLREQGVEVLLA